MFRRFFRPFTAILIILVIFGLTGCLSLEPAATTPATTTSTNPTTIPQSNTTTSAIVTTTPVETSITAAPTTTTSEPSTIPPATFVPDAAVYIPTGAELELFQYMLSLINSDRQAAGLPPVTLNYNAAAQYHALDMLDNFFISHWGTDGLKPYMRYTLAGGLGKDAENSAYSGWFDASVDPGKYAPLDVRQEIAELQYAMMYDDAASNWGHRDTILNRHYTSVNLGIAYNDKRLALVQQFEVNYLEFYQPPAISHGKLTFAGRLTTPNIEINNVSIVYEPVPEPLSNAELNSNPAYTDGYGLGQRINFVIPPAPAGQMYSNLSPLAIIADKWDTDDTGRFSLEADVSVSLGRGPGVYTIVVVAFIDGESVNLTNYSIFLR